MTPRSRQNVRCGCKPGTPENGWHEERSEACIQAELQTWRHMLTMRAAALDDLSRISHEVGLYEGDDF